MTRVSLVVCGALLVGCSRTDPAKKAADTAEGDKTSEPTATAPPTVVERPVMVLIPSGTTEQGCTPGQEDKCDFDEVPSHRVTLTRSFQLSQTEVTQGQFESLMGYNPSSFRGPRRPVETVSWHEAAAYSNALSVLEALRPCYVCQGSGAEATCAAGEEAPLYACEGYRLPTEAEWEHAARCGEDLKYAGSDTLREVGWWRRNSQGEAREVGLPAPNACGLVDMSGNVWEWTSDAYDFDYYQDRPRTDPGDPPQGFFRVARGGSWNSSATNCRLADRFSSSPTSRDSTQGFRLARTAADP